MILVRMTWTHIFYTEITFLENMSLNVRVDSVMFLGTGSLTSMKVRFEVSQDQREMSVPSFLLTLRFSGKARNEVVGVFPLKGIAKFKIDKTATIEADIPLYPDLLWILNDWAESAENDGNLELSADIHGVYYFSKPTASNAEITELGSETISGQTSLRVPSSDWSREAMKGRMTVELKRQTLSLIDELRRELNLGTRDEVIEVFYDMYYKSKSSTKEDSTETN